MSRKLKDSEVYLRAAEAVASNVDRYTCIAVSKACGKFYEWSGDVPVPHVDRYVSAFAADAYKLQDGFCECSIGEERQNCRVLALLFMHEIAKDEERNRK